MSFYFARTLSIGFDEALRRTTELLKHEGFGIIIEIDVKDTFKKKIGVGFHSCRILGVNSFWSASLTVDSFRRQL